jgi:glycosyltransferase involved in cell wall biosynthesis
VRVGLNLFFMNPQAGGAGTYARELIPAMLAAEPSLRLTAFVCSEVPDDMTDAPWAASVDWVRFPLTVTHGPPGTFVLNGAAQWLAEPAIALRRRLDVVHGLANFAPLWQPRAASVVTLLDLIWLRFPTTMDKRATTGMKLTAIPSARRADRVIAISHAAKADIVESIGLDPATIDVTQLGVRVDPAAPADEGALRERLGLRDRHVILCVAQKRVHKNLTGLVRAVAALGREDTVLVLVGSPTPHEQELRDLAAELGVADRVVFPEWLADADLEGLYRLARAFALPSFEEGFGLPILEAMARDLPVACSDVSSLPEVAGDAAELFDPRDPASIAAALGRLLDATDERRAELVALGRARCEHFTWDATARATLDCYRRAIEGKQSASLRTRLSRSRRV